MKMTRTAIATVVLACFALACSTTSTTETDDSRPTTQPLEAPEMNLAMPEHTRALVRVHPEQIGALLEAVTMRAEAAGAPGVTHIERPEVLIAIALLSPAVGSPDRLSLRRHLVRQIVNADKEDFRRASKLFPSIDGSRPIVLAMSTRGNQAMLKQLRYGLPMYADWEGYPAGWSKRVFIPVSDPEHFHSNLNDSLSDLRLTKKSIRHVGSHDGYVAVDIHQPTFQERFGAESNTVDWEAADDDFWRRDTPALRAFLREDSAIAIYARAADFSPLGALSGMTQAANALESATPENRRAMYSYGSVLAGQTFVMQSSQAREFEDMALTIGADDDHGLFAAMFRSHTEQGARIADAAKLDAELPTILVDNAQLDFEWARDARAARRQAIQPEWMQALEGGERPARDLAEILRTTGFWGYAIAMLNYPEGFTYGLEQLEDEPFMPGFGAFGQVRDLYALRVRLGLSDDPSKPLPARLGGGFVALVHRDSQLASRLEDFIEQLRPALPVDISLETEESAGKTLIRVALGPQDERFGAPEPVAGLRAQLSLDQLPRLDTPRRRAAESAMALTMLSELSGALTMLQGAGELRIDDAQTRQGTALRIHLGAGDTRPLTVPQSAGPLAQPQQPNACLRQAAHASRSMLEHLSDLRHSADMPSFFDRVDERLDAAEERCAQIDDRTRQTLDWMRTRWRAHEGRWWAEQFRWERALKLLDTACNAGDSRACADQEKTRDYQRRLGLVQVDSPTVALDAIPSRPAVLTGAGIGWWSMGMLGDMQGEQTVKFEKLESAKPSTIDNVVNRLAYLNIGAHGHGQVGVVTLPINRTVSSKTARAAVDLVHAKDMDRERKKARLLNEVPPQGAAATGFVVATEDEPGLGLLLVRSADDTSHPTQKPIIVTVSEDGLLIGHGEGEATQLKTCASKDGDECTVDADKAADHIGRLLHGDVDADKAAQLLAELTQWYGVGQLAETLDELGVSADKPYVVIRAQTEVPFGLLAQVHASLNEWASQEAPSGATPFVVLDE